MNKDKALEELFLAKKPHFADDEAFMASLVKRLDAVECIKQHQEATLRRYKLAMVMAFVAGLVGGGTAIAYLLSTPADIPLFTLKSNAAILLWLSEYSRVITATALSMLMTCGLINIITNVQEIMDMRIQLKQIGKEDR